MSAVEREARGDCFGVAYGFLTAGMPAAWAQEAGQPLVLGPKSPYRIVHGVPLGTGGEAAGKRYWHAWVEVATPSGVFVVDLSNGHDDLPPIPRAVYYAIGSLTEDRVWRYTPKEAERLYRKHQRTGPWVDGYETLGALRGEQS